MCPRCVTEMEEKGEWWSGRTCECGKCKGTLADKPWLESNMEQGDYLRLKKRVFTGSPAGFLCPHCLSIRPQSPIEMSKFTVSPGGKTYEVDGCLKCGSMWFDHGELESYEEGEVGDPSPVKNREKSDPVETLANLETGANALEVGATAIQASAETTVGILDVLGAILSGF